MSIWLALFSPLFFGPAAQAQMLTAETGAVEASCRTTGPQNIAVIVADYEGSTAPLTNLAYVKELFNGTGLAVESGASIANFYKTISGGRATFNTIQFAGPYHLPQTLSFDSQGPLSHQSVLDQFKKSVALLAERDIDFSKVNRIVFFTPAAIDVRTGQEYQAGAGAASNYCDFGFGDLQDGAGGKRLFAQAWIHAQHRLAGIDPKDISTHWDQYSAAQKAKMILQRKLEDMEPIAHEIGHTFGLGHANRISRPSVMNLPHTYDEILPDTNVELYEFNYGDVASFMASGAMGWPSMPHLAQLNWVDPKSIQYVKKNGTFRVYKNQNSASVLKALRIPRWKKKNEKTRAELWLEYRQLATVYDQSPLLTQLKTNGPLVYYVNPDQPVPSGWNFPNQTILLNFEPPGTIEPGFPTDYTLQGEWKDVHSLVDLKVLAVTKEYVDVAVSFKK